MTLFTILRDGTVSANFDGLKEKARSMSIAELRYAIKDCHEAERAMPESPKAGFYLDCIHVYGAEISRRNA